MITDERRKRKKSVSIQHINILTSTGESALLDVNAHTEQNPDGEIRGQITPLDRRY
ncbi:CHRD domain-containing protein [Thalassobacillus devorans]|uniref:CHRD domain-containing protein n=1 Tax=Thalassobacillus devorans TaxID=279813 RepID=UPI0011DE1800|nr:CHRD domain-containing protein [Thalassobacillus devorans]